MNLAAAARDLLVAFDEGPAGEVRRAVLEVTYEGRSELVTVTLKPDGALFVVASDGNTSGPHVRTALELLAGLYDQRRPSSTGASIPPKAPPPNPREELAAAVDDLLLAVVRQGVAEAYGTMSVDQAIEGVIEAAGKPVPHGLGRFVGRLRAALADRDVHTTARLLDGASRLVQNLRADFDGRSTSEARAHLAAWLGRPTDLDLRRRTVQERALVEVGREWVSGVERHALQRRYLVEVATGEIFAEEEPRTGVGSVGPCPRRIVVGLGEVHPGPAPRRLRPLQYSVGIDLTSEVWEQVASVAVHSAEDLGPRYRSEIKSFPALAEPVALVRATRLDPRRGVLRTPAGDTLALRFQEGVGEHLLQRVGACSVRWVFGKLYDSPEGQLALDPISVGLDVHGVMAFERLR